MTKTNTDNQCPICGQKVVESKIDKGFMDCTHCSFECSINDWNRRYIAESENIRLKESLEKAKKEFGFDDFGNPVVDYASENTRLSLQVERLEQCAVLLRELTDETNPLLEEDGIKIGRIRKKSQEKLAEIASILSDKE